MKTFLRKRLYININVASASCKRRVKIYIRVFIFYLACQKLFYSVVKTVQCTFIDTITVCLNNPIQCIQIGVHCTL